MIFNIIERKLRTIETLPGVRKFNSKFEKNEIGLHNYGEPLLLTMHYHALPRYYKIVGSFPFKQRHSKKENIINTFKPIGTYHRYKL